MIVDLLSVRHAQVPFESHNKTTNFNFHFLTEEAEAWRV